MSRAPTGTVTQVEHEVVRLSIDTGVPFGVFRERYELAVPSLDVDRTLCPARPAGTTPSPPRPRTRRTDSPAAGEPMWAA